VSTNTSKKVKTTISFVIKIHILLLLLHVFACEQVVTRLVHFMYTGELVVGGGELEELRSLGRALGAAALLHQLACLEAQLAASRPHASLFSLGHHQSSGYKNVKQCCGFGSKRIRTFLQLCSKNIKFCLRKYIKTAFKIG